MSKPARLFAPRPLLLSSQTSQSLCRRTSFKLDTLVRPTRQRLLYTTRPLSASIATSATSGLDTALNPSSSVVSSSSSNSSNTLATNASTNGRTGLQRGRGGERATVLRVPTKEDIEEAELDVDVLPAEESIVLITERAAEQLRRISTRENDPDVALRVSVDSGGCHGYQYKLDLTSVNKREPDDYLFAHPTIQPSNILVDAVSLPLLKGSTLDFITELIGSSFRVSDNPQAKGSGCGCGVSWELKI